LDIICSHGLCPGEDLLYFLHEIIYLFIILFF